MTCLTGRIVAIISPDCQHKPGQRFCCLAISSTFVPLCIDKRLSTLPPSGVICKMSMRAHSCPRQLRTMKNCHLVYQQSLQSSWGLRQFWCHLQKPLTCDPGRIQERCTVLFPSSRRPGCTYNFKLWLSRWEEKMLGSITVLVCRKINCALHRISVCLRPFYSPKKW